MLFNVVKGLNIYNIKMSFLKKKFFSNGRSILVFIILLSLIVQLLERLQEPILKNLNFLSHITLECSIIHLTHIYNTLYPFFFNLSNSALFYTIGLSNTSLIILIKVWYNIHNYAVMHVDVFN